MHKPYRSSINVCNIIPIFDPGKKEYLSQKSEE